MQSVTEAPSRAAAAEATTSLIASAASQQVQNSESRALPAEERVRLLTQELGQAKSEANAARRVADENAASASQHASNAASEARHQARQEAEQLFAAHDGQVQARIAELELKLAAEQKAKAELEQRLAERSSASRPLTPTRQERPPRPESGSRSLARQQNGADHEVFNQLLERLGGARSSNQGKG